MAERALFVWLKGRLVVSHQSVSESLWRKLAQVMTLRGDLFSRSLKQHKVSFAPLNVTVVNSCFSSRHYIMCFECVKKSQYWPPVALISGHVKF